ncbi:MAG TPA: glycine rich domain-containing protein [Bacilli bacterium]|nr:glycine rich domain-containing protein [Bacilli bacterium]
MKLKYCLVFVTSFIFTITISVLASSFIIPSEISYSNSYSKVDNLNDALNELKEKEGTACSYSSGKTFDFDYTGTEQIFTPECTGFYKLEVWGAQGDFASGYNVIAGYGGYSVGLMRMDSSTKYYINVGGAGKVNYSTNVNMTGGYNGGGDAYGCDGYTEIIGAGGGATHISSRSGLLSTLSANIDSILIVAGGGGGMTYYLSYQPFYHYGSGGSGGGYIGASTYNTYGGNLATFIVYGGTQTSGGVNPRNGAYNGYFGKGASYKSYCVSGGGGGFYGGSSSDPSEASAGGSGYIGSTSLLSYSSTIKHMTCYNCSTSTDASTMTNTTTNVSASATSDYAKSGNGFARITYLGKKLN